jgi:hypothetical protein
MYIRKINEKGQWYRRRPANQLYELTTKEKKARIDIT